MSFPIIDKELIDELKLTYLNTIPTRKLEDYEQGILRGNQEVIQKLEAEYSYQQEQLSIDTHTA